MSAVLVVWGESGRMRRLGDLAGSDLLERIDALAFGIESVHEMHVGDLFSIVFACPITYMFWRSSKYSSGKVQAAAYSMHTSLPAARHPYREKNHEHSLLFFPLFQRSLLDSGTQHSTRLILRHSVGIYSGFN